MTPEQSAAYVTAQATAALIEAMGMVAANSERAANGYTIAYGDEDFRALIDQYGISHNAVLGTFQQVQS